MAQVELLSPAASPAEVFIGQRVLRHVVVADGQKDVVEALAQPGEEGVLFHHGVENLRHRLQPLI